MVRDGRFTPATAQMRSTKRVEWVAKRTVILWPMDASLAIQGISAYAFKYELKRFLHPLLGARGSEEAAL